MFAVWSSDCLSFRLSVCLSHLPHVLHIKHWNSVGHVILGKTAFVGGDKAHGLDANAQTHTHSLTHCLTQITWTIRSFKRISQWEVAALESHAPDGYWSIISLHTDTHAKQAPLLLSVIINKLVTLLLHFPVLSVLGGSTLQSCAPLNSGFSTILSNGIGPNCLHHKYELLDTKHPNSNPHHIK